MSQLRASDLRGALEFVGELNEAHSDEAFPSELLGRLTCVVAAEGVAFNERDLLASEVIEESGWCAVEHDGDQPEGGEDPSGVWPWEFVRHHPVNVYRRRTGDMGAVANSDFWSRSARLKYQVFAPEYHEYWGLVDVAGIRLSDSATQTATVFVESHDRDFTARDKAVLDILRPHLAARRRATRLRRLLADALATLETGSQDAYTRAVVLVGAGDRIEFTSPAAAKLFARYFGASSTRLPQALADWCCQARDEAFTMRRDGHQLVVERTPGRRSPLMLREERVLATPLTAREWDVMRSVEAGMTNDEIAELLCISPATVKKHLEHVYEKLEVRTRTAALARLRPWLSGAAHFARERAAEQ